MSPPRSTSSPASRSGDCAVIGVDDEPSRAVYAKLVKRAGIAAVPVTLETPVAGGISSAPACWSMPTATPVDFADVPTLPGDHNAQNAACAWAACRWLGVPREKIVAGLTTYPGLPHRQERVASVGNVVYVNDSKATNADATAQALSSYHDIYWILGGQAKEGGVAPLAPWFERIRHAFLIGEATELFAGQLEGKIAYSRCGDLQVGARRRARARAARGAAERRARRGAAVAGLRLVGPVEELRAPRRCVPRHGARPAGRAGFGESSVIQVPRDDRSVIGQWWWTVDRWSLGAILAHHGLRRHADARRLAAGRRAHRRRFLHLRQAPVLLPADRADADAGDFARLAAPHPAAGAAGVLRQRRCCWPPPSSSASRSRARGAGSRCPACRACSPRSSSSRASP